MFFEHSTGNSNGDTGITIDEQIQIRKQLYNDRVGRPPQTFRNYSEYLAEVMNWTAKNTELYEITINTFIPDETFPESGNYGIGDNRDLFESGTSRTSHSVVVDIFTGKIVYEEKETSASHTKIYNPLTGEYVTFDPPDGGTLVSSADKNGKQTTINISGDEASSAFAWAVLDITYNFTINIDNNGSVIIKGTHDGFPAYEVMIDSPSGKKEGFGFNPRENSQYLPSLWGSGEWEVDYPKNLPDGYHKR
jgi:hypothetical protein